MTQMISKSKLKAQMLAIFRQLEAEGQELIVTDQGKPVLKITPLKPKNKVAELFGEYQGKVIYHADINQPTLDEWDEA
jgi:antitoxin (DNA-binding transcriptional repressor) of toxin-antitoxin stability system